MDDLDRHAQTAFTECQEHLEEMTPAYIAALSSYRQDVLRSLQTTWFKRGVKATDNDITKHLDRVMARVAIYLTPEQGAEKAPEPLLCGFMLDYAWKFMTEVDHGIAEVSIVKCGWHDILMGAMAKVCRWFEPLLDYWRFLHPKNHRMDDWSQVMMVNVAKDPRVMKNGVDFVVSVFSYSMRHYANYMSRLLIYFGSTGRRSCCACTTG